MEDALVHTCFFRLLCRHHAGDQVQRLDVAVQKPGILRSDHSDRLVGVRHVPGPQGDPQIGLDPLRKGVYPVGGAPADLPVDELVAGIHLFNHFLQKFRHLRLGTGRLDFQQPGAVVEPVQMLLQIPDNIVAAVGGIINTVSKEVCPVVHGNRHFIDLVIFAVIVA